MGNPTGAMVVIGDEILSGRTRDSNLHYLAGELTRVGIDLREARVVADDHAAIVAAVRALSSVHDHVFTSGGIGPTHDDITADAVAEAIGSLPRTLRTLPTKSPTSLPCCASAGSHRFSGRSSLAPPTTTCSSSPSP